MLSSRRDSHAGSMAREPSYLPPATSVEREPAVALAGVLSPQDLKKAPARLYLAGDEALLRAPGRVSIVGSREASEAGRARAARLARIVIQASGVVVSGLARGIDRAAHESAIAAGGRTIAVIGTPLTKAYPIENAQLQQAIYTSHLLVSQFAPSEKVFPSNFPRRNRVMALISHATVIVEASDTSGALSQASECQRLGRDLYILKSVIEDKRLTWPEAFLKSGAIALEDPKDLLARFANYKGA